MKHCIYKVTNRVNGKYYIGKHSSEDPVNDAYMGSGESIRAAIKKYGVENFTKEILEYCDSAEKAYLREQEMLTEEVLKDPCCYNRCKGGNGGRKGSIHMHRGNKNILVSEDKVPFFKEQGYSVGRSEDIVEKHREKCLGKITVYLENKERSVLPEELQNYLDRGWQRGRVQSFRDKHVKQNKTLIWMSCDSKETRVHPEQKEKYLKEGWKEGHSDSYRSILSKVNKGRIRIHKDSVEKMVLPVDLETCLLGGWERGYSEQSKKNRCRKGKDKLCWYNDGTFERKFTSQEVVPESWKKGRLSSYSDKTKKMLEGRTTIYRENEERKVSQEHLQAMLNDGWFVGRSPKNIQLAKLGKNK